MDICYHRLSAPVKQYLPDQAARCMCTCVLMFLCEQSHEIGQIKDELRTAESRFNPASQFGKITTLQSVYVDLSVMAEVVREAVCVCCQSFSRSLSLHILIQPPIDASQ